LEEEVAKYKKWQKRLLAAKPGITWYAQVFGRDLPFEEEAKLDLYRFQNWSVWMDIVVILWVFRTLLKGK
jgi:lipopolysaccharide/colanic/teichoic acid biosynthesis glycosyltransferase